MAALVLMSGAVVRHEGDAPRNNSDNVCPCTDSVVQVSQHTPAAKGKFAAMRNINGLEMSGSPQALG